METSRDQELAPENHRILRKGWERGNSPREDMVMELPLSGQTRRPETAPTGEHVRGSRTQLQEGTGHRHHMAELNSEEGEVLDAVGGEQGHRGGLMRPAGRIQEEAKIPRKGGREVGCSWKQMGWPAASVPGSLPGCVPVLEPGLLCKSAFS